MGVGVCGGGGGGGGARACWYDCTVWSIVNEGDDALPDEALRGKGCQQLSGNQWPEGM